MIKRQQVSFSYQAPYYTIGKLTNQTDYIWIIFHGYGQLAEYFSKKFEILDTDKHFILAPQGLSTHYLKQFTGRVGANWMTKHEREFAIQNNMIYIDAVLEAALSGIDLKDKKLLVVGFSQGAATASRWIAHTTLDIYHFLVWGGSIAHDIEAHFYNKIRNRLTIAIGDKDEFITEERLQNALLMLQNANISPHVLRYEGEHKIYESVLVNFVQQTLNSF